MDLCMEVTVSDDTTDAASTLSTSTDTVCEETTVVEFDHAYCSTVSPITMKSACTQVNMTEIAGSWYAKNDDPDLPGVTAFLPVASSPPLASTSYSCVIAQETPERTSRGPIITSTPTSQILPSPQVQNISMTSTVGEETDESYYPSEDSFFEGDTTTPECPVEQRKFIVFEAPLLELFKACRSCSGSCKVTTSVRGTLLTVVSECASGHKFSWNSQPELNRMAAGNVLLSGAILFNGASPTKVLRLLSSINIQMISKVAYDTYQKGCLLPAVSQVWNAEHNHLLLSLQDKPVDLLGDGRCDSPGHCAKYMTYTFMEAHSKKIVSSVQVQVGESPDVASSTNMEKVGFVRCLDELKSNHIIVASITTDRHPAVRKHMREMEPSIVHGFDTWHVVKVLCR
ncbi:uncharacterized protein LOC135394033 [Ornithodoros turicata]|uniref:uncharacterized protein LOC135394033 n=1 Tax=Ornithodoros turicata TaxID=34597 RepID=UPI0031390AB0